MAFFPNCVHCQDLDQSFSHLKNLRSSDWLPTKASNNTNSSSLVYGRKTKLYSWWQICRKAKVIRWFSTELRSLLWSKCWTKVKQPGINIESTVIRLPNLYRIISFPEIVTKTLSHCSILQTEIKSKQEFAQRALNIILLCQTIWRHLNRIQ